MSRENTKDHLHRLQRFLADLVFPITCLGCGRAGRYLCTACQVSLPRRAEQRCPHCHHVTAYGQTCLDCTPHTPLHGLFAALSYQTPLIRRLIQAYKYRFVTDLAPLLTGPLVIALRNAELPLPHYLIPVPLHDRRLRWRNFNQSSLIAHILAEKLTPGFPLTLLDQHLQRTRATLPQAKTKHRSERLENLHGAFAWRPPESHPPIDIADASIWLIDDVATTNATLEECARVLKAHGAKSVYGIVIAR